jgi:HEAT repeat protein
MFAAPPLPRTLEASLRDLGAQKPSVRASAAHDLTRHESDARALVIPALVKALGDEAGEVRAAAATALADVEGVEALPDLLIALEDPDALVRQMAIAALGEIGDPRATERLRRALSDARAEVRFQAVIAYPRGCASRDAALEALLAATRDDDPLVCHIALRMSEELGEGEVDPRVLTRARALLGRAAPEVRVASAILLAHSGDRAGAAVIGEVGAGKLKTTVREDEAAAVELCGALGLDAARAGLEKRAFGGMLGFLRDPFAWHARVALARLGHERAAKEILRELGDRDRDVRTLAVAAAGRARLGAARAAITAMRGDAERADPDAVTEALAALDQGASPS